MILDMMGSNYKIRHEIEQKILPKNIIHYLKDRFIEKET